MLLPKRADFLPALLSWGEGAQAVVTSWEDRAQGIPGDSIKCGWRNQPEWGGQRGSGAGHCVPSSPPLEVGASPKDTCLANMQNDPRMRKTQLQGRTYGLSRPLVAPTRAEGPCGHTLWSCDWLSHSELNRSHNRQTREKVTITAGPLLTEVSFPYFR